MAKLKTTAQFKKEVFDLVGEEYSVLGEYEGANKKIKMRHNKCGSEYMVRASHFLGGTRCRKCAFPSKTTEQFKKEVYEMYGNEYTVLGGHKTARIKILMRHNKCGYEYEVTPDSFLQGNRCHKCFGGVRKTQEQFEKEVFDLVGEEYTVIGKYKSSRTKIKMRHNKCGYEYEVVPYSFLAGRRCTKCKYSKGEKRIEKFLQDNNIIFKKEKAFADLKDTASLRFDFYLPNYNSIIEYDGEHHFEPVKFGGISEEVAKENFANTRRRDHMKNKYCKDKSINLLRIPYTEFDSIEKILKEELE